MKYVCPHCGESNLSMEVKTWAGFFDSQPDTFDDEDIAYVEVIPDGNTVCKECSYYGLTADFIFVETEGADE